MLLHLRMRLRNIAALGTLRRLAKAVSLSVFVSRLMSTYDWLNCRYQANALIEHLLSCGIRIPNRDPSEECLGDYPPSGDWYYRR
jgi:hypothetical protein